MKNTLLLLTTTFVCLSFHSTSTMNTPAESALFEDYREKCCSILHNDEKKLDHYKNILEVNMFTSQQISQEKSILLNKLALYRENLSTKADAILHKIKNDHNVDSHMWNACINMVIETHKYDEKNQLTALSTTYHDTTIPLNIRQLFIDRLQWNNVNPQRVSFYNKPNLSFPHINYCHRKAPHIYENSCSAANTHQLEIYVDAEQFSILPLDHQIALGVYAIEGLIQNPKLLPEAIVELEPLFAHNSKSIVSTIVANNDFIELTKLCNDTLPILLPCFQNATIAKCMLDFYFEYYYTNFTLDDYKFLSKVCRRWNMIKLLEGYLNPPSEMEEATLSSSK